MDVLGIILMFILISVFSDKKDSRKKKRLPTGQPFPMPEAKAPTEEGAKIRFKIPKLKNAPTDAGNSRVYHEAESLEARLKREQEEWQEAQRRQAREEEKARQEAAIRAEEQKIYSVATARAKKEAVRGIAPILTPETAQQAVIFAEILGKPKAYQRNRGRFSRS